MGQIRSLAIYTRKSFRFLNPSLEDTNSALFLTDEEANI